MVWEMAEKYTRKRLFVDSKVQGSLVRQLVMHWALACFLIFLYLFTLQTFAHGFTLSFKENLGMLWRQYGMLLLVILVISPVFIYDSIKLSNRFVGPMIKFRRALAKLANGEDTGEITFRENDFWKDLTQDFNAIAGELKTKRDGPNSSEKSSQSNEEQLETVESA